MQLKRKSKGSRFSGPVKRTVKGKRTRKKPVWVPLSYTNPPLSGKKLEQRLKKKEYRKFSNLENIGSKLKEENLCYLCNRLLEVDDHQNETKSSKWIIEHRHDNEDGSGPFRGKSCNSCNNLLAQFDKMAKKRVSYKDFEDSYAFRKLSEYTGVLPDQIFPLLDKGYDPMEIDDEFN